jgi:hypothetical protein
MTPALPDVLMGQFIAISAPLPPEAAGDYLAGRMAMIGMLTVLAAQEAERGPAARVWENGALRALFARTADRYDEALGGALGRAAGGVDADLTWSGLDADNAALRRLLIALHQAAEARGDTALDREILALYVAMAAHRRLDLPSALG